MIGIAHRRIGRLHDRRQLRLRQAGVDRGNLLRDQLLPRRLLVALIGDLHGQAIQVTAQLARETDCFAFADRLFGQDRGRQQDGDHHQRDRAGANTHAHEGRCRIVVPAGHYDVIGSIALPKPRTGAHGAQRLAAATEQGAQKGAAGAGGTGDACGPIGERGRQRQYIGASAGDWEQRSHGVELAASKGQRMDRETRGSV